MSGAAKGLTSQHIRVAARIASARDPGSGSRIRGFGGRRSQRDGARYPDFERHAPLLTASRRASGALRRLYVTRSRRAPRSTFPSSAPGRSAEHPLEPPECRSRLALEQDQPHPNDQQEHRQQLVGGHPLTEEDAAQAQGQNRAQPVLCRASGGTSPVRLRRKAARFSTSSSVISIPSWTVTMIRHASSRDSTLPSWK